MILPSLPSITKMNRDKFPFLLFEEWVITMGSLTRGNFTTKDCPLERNTTVTGGKKHCRETCKLATKVTIMTYFNYSPENLLASAFWTTPLSVFANINFGNRRLLEDISIDTHWINSFVMKGHVSAEEKTILIIFLTRYLRNSRNTCTSQIDSWTYEMEFLLAWA